MSQVISRDGTAIDYDRMGDGPPLILIMGAFNDRRTGAPLAELLAKDFTVFNYDRRGKGASGDVQPYTVEREIEDLQALIAEAGGAADVFGFSSGAVLALRAAVAGGAAIGKLVLYEPPIGGPAGGNGIAPQLEALVAQGKRGEAVELFQTQVIGIPEPVVIRSRNAPIRPYLESLAHTTVYDTWMAMDAPTGERLAGVGIPVLALAGDRSAAPFRQAVERLADDLPQGRYVCLTGQSHRLVAPVLAPVVKQFLLG